MKTNYSISIPKPCHEDWSKMTPNEKGRFCQSCSKTVVDFSKMNVEEIQDYIHKNKNERICGHINQNQLNAINLKIPEAVFNQNLSFHRLFLLALLFSMGMTLFNCSDENGLTKKIETIEIIEKTMDSSLIKNIQLTDTITKSNAKQIDSAKVKAIEPPLPIIMGDIVQIEGEVEIHYKEPYAYNYVDEKPEFLNTPTHLSDDEKRAYFHKEIKAIIDENFKTDQENLGLKGKQRIYCQFTINKNGVLENLEIKAPHPSYEDETKRVFKLFPKFVPAKHKSENVSVMFTLPIAFVIED